MLQKKRRCIRPELGLEAERRHAEEPQFDPAWGRAVRMDLPSFRGTRSGLRRHRRLRVGLAPADLEHKVDTGFMGEQTTAFIVGNVCVWHVAEHNGEIAALKGAQGLKGLPF
jgi:hypothetical protein